MNHLLKSAIKPEQLHNLLRYMRTFTYGNETLITSDEVGYMQEITPKQWKNLVTLAKFDRHSYKIKIDAEGYGNATIEHIVLGNVVIATRFASFRQHGTLNFERLNAVSPYIYHTNEAYENI